MASSSSPSTGKKKAYFTASTGAIGKTPHLADWVHVTDRKFWNPGKSKNKFGKKK